MKTIFTLIGYLSFFSITAQVQLSPFIHYDQFGYLPEAEKVAVLSDPIEGFNGAEGYSPAGMIQLVNAVTSEVVFEALPVLWNDGSVHEDSGDRGWWFDFSSVTEEGTYYILDPESTERSYWFDISPTIYEHVITAAQRMFFYNRCNFPKAAPYAEANWVDAENNFVNPGQDTECKYVYDPNNAALFRDLSGGWFDAGDYNKYVTFASTAVHNLLAAYEENPNAFTDQLNIPESGNGLPDILDEVKWELDWLLKMCNDDGSVHIKMGSIEFDENVEAPPSANVDPRYYGPTCTSASITIAAMFAYAAIIYESIDGYENYAATLEAQAEKCWDYVQPFLQSDNLEEDCDDGTIKAGDADVSAEDQKNHLIAAAVYLFDLTGRGVYHQYILDHVYEARPITENFWGPYTGILNDALLRYTTFTTIDALAVASIAISLDNDVENNWNGYYGFNDADLYRSFMPNWSYHWGSNSPKAGYSILNSLVLKYGIPAANNLEIEKQMSENLHYFHGVNPLGMVMLSNMYGDNQSGKVGDRCVNEIYHTWFYDGTEWDNAQTSSKGPAPGFLTGGPNKDFSLGTISPPANNPAMKSYLDFNDGFPNNSWEISEPAIYYQAAYIRMLAHFVTIDLTTSDAEITSKTNNLLEFFPNPIRSDELININLKKSVTGKMQIFDMQGKLLESKVLNNENQVRVNSLVPGVYLFQVMDRGEKIGSQKMVVYK